MKSEKNKQENLFSVEEAMAYSKKLIKGWHSKEIPQPGDSLKDAIPSTHHKKNR